MFGIKQNMKFQIRRSMFKSNQKANETNSKFCFRNGFTLLELMTTMSVAAILLGIAIPSYQTFIQNSRLNSSAEKIYRVFNSARQEALASGKKTMVCKFHGVFDPDDPKCTNDANTQKAIWDFGFVTYTSPVGMGFPQGDGRYGNHRIDDATFTTNPDADTVAERKALVMNYTRYEDNGIDFVTNAVGGNGNDSQQTVIAFNGDGTFDNAEVNDFSAFRIAICDDRGDEFGKYIEINAVGRVFLKNTSSTDVGCDGA